MTGHGGRPERAPLGSLAALADPPWAPWPMPEVLESTPSTMLDVERRARDGAPEGTVVVAEEQTAGRGRRGRTWESAARAGLWWSLLLRPSTPADQLGWLPLLVGVGVARGIRAATGVSVGLKWPNDIVAPSGKVAGLLAERLGDESVVVGVGVNVDHDVAELPMGAASIRALGHVIDRADLFVAICESIALGYRDWLQGAEVGAAYRDFSVTLGSDVRVELGDRVVIGRAHGLGPSGQLLVTDATGADHAISAGDVTLLRPEP